LGEEVNRQDACAIEIGIPLSRRVRKLHFQSSRPWRGSKGLTQGISSGILELLWGWSSPISAAKADGSCHAWATSHAVVGANLKQPPAVVFVALKNMGGDDMNFLEDPWERKCNPRSEIWSPRDRCDKIIVAVLLEAIKESRLSGDVAAINPRSRPIDISPRKGMRSHRSTASAGLSS